MKSLPDNIVIVGAGGHAKVVIATVRAAGGEVVAAYDDDRARWGQQILGVPVKGPISAKDIGGAPAIVAVGNNRTRQSIAERLQAQWVSACHPNTTVHPSVSIGPGTVIFAGSVIQPDATIGAHSILNTAVSVDHDCIVGDFVHIGPGARLCGGVTVDEGVLLGVGAKIAPNVEIGPWATAGAGAVCVVDIARETTVVGVPARSVEAKE
ncbi:MAG: acetyltransferase [Myxococcales bacterium]|nr:acetyltransferase [Myxococcales bacterium]MDH3485713.1 acetyltransferase [Myxococcales bacterium]